MKIALLSFVNNLNYGGSLQEYALAYAVKKYGGENVTCEYLNYHRNFFKDTAMWLLRKVFCRITGRDDVPSWTLKEFFHIVLAACRPDRSDSTQEFKKFWRQTDFSSKMRKKELRKIEDAYDLFIAGSDQIWNCGRLNLDTTYLLDFLECKKKKGSYASSVGMPQIPKKYEKKYRKYWKNMRYLSCRETQGARLIESLTGRRVKTVLDPTLLLNKEEWEEVADQSVAGQGKFVLLYMLDQSDQLESFAEKLAHSKNRKIVKIYGDIAKNRAIGPRQWLGYFLSAEEVVTNSFHGTAFSVNFQKNFYVEITPKPFFGESSSRIMDFLQNLDLQDRLIDHTEENKIEKMTDIQYEHINKKLEKMKEASVKYLARMLENYG